MWRLLLAAALALAVPPFANALATAQDDEEEAAADEDWADEASDDEESESGADAADAEREDEDGAAEEEGDDEALDQEDDAAGDEDAATEEEEEDASQEEDDARVLENGAQEPVDNFDDLVAPDDPAPAATPTPAAAQAPASSPVASAPAKPAHKHGDQYYRERHETLELCEQANGKGGCVKNFVASKTGFRSGLPMQEEDGYIPACKDGFQPEATYFEQTEPLSTVCIYTGSNR
jgi:hypothetical protein